MAEEKNPWGEFKEATSGEFVKWDEVGKEVLGILTSVEEKEDLMNPGQMQKIYTLQDEDKNEMCIGGRRSIDSNMRKAVVGQWIKMVYEKDIPSKTKGNNAFKLIKVYLGQVDPSFSDTNLPNFDN